MTKARDLARFGSNAAVLSQFKNRIINGAMVIDQRNAGASVSIALPSTTYFAVDRFQTRMDTSTGSTIQQSTTAPSGFVNSYVVTVGTGGTPAASAFNYFGQRVEGFNIADLGWGTANAKTVTLSFWVRSSLTGTFGVSLRNASTNRSYVSSYTISAADTWEYKTITIVGDTGGTWNTTNGVGIFLFWDIGAGSDNSTSTTNSWQAANFSGLTGGVKLCQTTGATFYITGVQLEVGSTATSFDYRPYGTELALCQRYYAKFNTLSGNYSGYGVGVVESATGATVIVKYPQTMRATPTLAQSSTALYDGAAFRTVTSLGSVYYGDNTLNANVNANTGLTIGRGCVWFAGNTTAAYIDISSGAITMYKQHPIHPIFGKPQSICRLSDGAAIPFATDNTDYANFKAQINADEAQLEDADGNLMTAEQAKEFVASLE